MGESRGADFMITRIRRSPWLEIFESLEPRQRVDELRTGAVISIGICCLVLAGGNGCANENSMDYGSPDGNLRVVRFARDCGASVDSNIQISVLPSSMALPNPAGNALMVDTNQFASSLQDIDVVWISNSSLRITHPRNPRIFKREKRVGIVDVIYVAQ